jgi:hypothetical protein
VEEVVAGDQEHLAVSILILIQTRTILTVYIDGLRGGRRRGTPGHSTGNSRSTRRSPPAFCPFPLGFGCYADG